jgi:putative methionine-R-sulfoxide reductase with GAF domain
MPTEESKTGSVLAFIRKQILILNWVTVLTVFVLLLIILWISYDFLDYMPTGSIVHILAITAGLCVISIYVAKLIVAKAMAAIDDYGGKLNALLSIIDDIREVGYIGILLKNIVREAMDKAHADGGSVLLAEGDSLVVRASRGHGDAQLSGFSFPRSGGIAGWVVENRNAVIINDVRNSSIYSPGIDDRAGYGTGSVICVPLRQGMKIIGALKVESREAGAFSAEDENLLLLYADHAVTSIEKTKQYEERDNYGVHLTDILMEAVENLTGKRLR